MSRQAREYALSVAGSASIEALGLAPDDKVRRTQHRMEPLSRRVFGGCHLTRPIVDLVRRAGFEIA